MDVLGRSITGCLIFILAFIIPESPRWLAAKEVKEKYDWRALSQPGVRRVLILGIVLAVSNSGVASMLYSIMPTKSFRLPVMKCQMS